jgi:hypothetical protein
MRAHAKELESASPIEDTQPRNQDASHVSAQDWAKRAYAPSDEDACVYLWLKSYAHSSYGKARGAHRQFTDAERAYWAEQAPIVESLIRHATVEIICDPDEPNVIWAFVAFSPAKEKRDDVVHMIVVKRSVVKAGFAAEIVGDLLGSLASKPCAMTHEIPDFRPRKNAATGKLEPGPCGLWLPRGWYNDHTWLVRQAMTPREPAKSPLSARLRPPEAA